MCACVCWKAENASTSTTYTKVLPFQQWLPVSTKVCPVRQGLAISGRSSHFSKVYPFQQSMPLSAKSTHLSKVYASQKSAISSESIHLKLVVMILFVGQTSLPHCLPEDLVLAGDAFMAVSLSLCFAAAAHDVPFTLSLIRDIPPTTTLLAVHRSGVSQQTRKKDIEGALDAICFDGTGKQEIICATSDCAPPEKRWNYVCMFNDCVTIKRWESCRFFLKLLKL